MVGVKLVLVVFFLSKMRCCFKNQIVQIHIKSPACIIVTFAYVFRLVQSHFPPSNYKIPLATSQWELHFTFGEFPPADFTLGSCLLKCNTHL